MKWSMRSCLPQNIGHPAYILWQNSQKAQLVRFRRFLLKIRLEDQCQEGENTVSGLLYNLTIACSSSVCRFAYILYLLQYSSNLRL